MPDLPAPPSGPPEAPLPIAVAPKPQRYLVEVPNPAFKDQRYGFEFQNGRLVLNADAKAYVAVRSDPNPVPVSALDLFRTDLRYRVEPIPDDVDPFELLRRPRTAPS